MLISNTIPCVGSTCMKVVDAIKFVVCRVPSERAKHPSKGQHWRCDTRNTSPFVAESRLIEPRNMLRSKKGGCGNLGDGMHENKVVTRVRRGEGQDSILLTFRFQSLIPNGSLGDLEKAVPLASPP